MSGILFLLPVFRVGYVATDATLTRTVGIDDEIPPGVGMAIFAHGFCGIDCGGTIATQDIDTVDDLLEMIGITAGMNPTEMVQSLPRDKFSARPQIGETVNEVVTAIQIQ
jgi:hypothetical protein